MCVCVCARPKKEFGYIYKMRKRGGERGRKKAVARRGRGTSNFERVRVHTRVYVCVRVCLKRNIFLYYYSHRAYFSYPSTCIPGGWVCSFFLSPSLSFYHFVYVLSVSFPAACVPALPRPSFLSVPTPVRREVTGRTQPPEPAAPLLFPFLYIRAHRIACTREIARRARRRARTEETERIY